MTGVQTCALRSDPFFGSGTTGLAAAKNNRSFIGIEINPKKSNKETLVSFSGKAIKESVKKQAENSEDTALRNAVISTSAVMTATEILKPEKTEISPKITKGNKRKTVYNKAQIMLKAKNLNIKSEFKNQFKGIVKQANSSAKKAIKIGGSSIMKSIKSNIEEAGENDLADRKSVV